MSVLFGGWSAQAFTHISPTCPLRRMVCRGAYTCLLLVLFGGWSAQALTHVSYLSFSADGLHRRLRMSPTCPFRWMVCTGAYTCLLPVLFGGWSAQTLTHASSLSFSADGLHRRLHMTLTCPFRRMVCTSVYTCLLLVHFGGWSAQAIALLCNLSFSANDGLHGPFVLFGGSPACHIRRMVCTGLTHVSCSFHHGGRNGSVEKHCCGTVAPWGSLTRGRGE